MRHSLRKTRISSLKIIGRLSAEIENKREWERFELETKLQIERQQLINEMNNDQMLKDATWQSTFFEI